jgi:hypothetical protein
MENMFEPSGLTYIQNKTAEWVNRMTNGHLPAFKHQLWPGLQYNLGTMTNDLESATKLVDNVNYKTLNLLGVMCSATKGLRKIHTTFGGCGLFNLPTEQLISQVNMFFNTTRSLPT